MRDAAGGLEFCDRDLFAGALNLGDIERERIDLSAEQVRDLMGLVRVGGEEGESSMDRAQERSPWN